MRAFVVVVLLSRIAFTVGIASRARDRAGSRSLLRLQAAAAAAEEKKQTTIVADHTTEESSGGFALPKFLRDILLSLIPAKFHSTVNSWVSRTFDSETYDVSENRAVRETVTRSVFEEHPAGAVSGTYDRGFTVGPENGICAEMPYYSDGPSLATSFESHCRHRCANDAGCVAWAFWGDGRCKPLTVPSLRLASLDQPRDRLPIL